MNRLALALTISAGPAMADVEGYGRMMDGGFGYGAGMMFGSVLWLLVLGLIVVGILWFVRRLDHGLPHHGKSSGIAELDMRFARGEIEAEDYAARKKLLGT